MPHENEGLVKISDLIMDELGIVTGGATTTAKGVAKGAAQVGSTALGVSGAAKSLTATPPDLVGASLNGVSAIPGVNVAWSIACFFYDLLKGFHYGP